MCDQVASELTSTPQAHQAPTLLMDREETAELLGVSTTTLWPWRRDGVIPAPVKIESVERWVRADIESFVASLRGTAA